MPFAKVHSAQANTLSVNPIDVEVDITDGLYSFVIIGLADKAINEAKDRIVSALKNSGLPNPKQSNKKITVALAPAHTQKSGPLFDLPIAIGYLQAIKYIQPAKEKCLFVGELSLDGSLRPVHGVLPIALHAKKHGYTALFVPEQNKHEAVAAGIQTFAVKTLSEIVEHLLGIQKIPVTQKESTTTKQSHKHDFAHIKGSASAKRACMIAAAGGHNIAFSGPPGTGKSLLAKSLPSIMPPMTTSEKIITSSIYSVRNMLHDDILHHRPFRAPHHTSSHTSICGGGAIPKPGEVSLAHNGILFLDELPEFQRKTLEALRQPLEDGHITISRTHGTVSYPASCMLVATLNPCPCGFKDSHKPCTCTPAAVHMYTQKISGPIIDRIDIWTHVAGDTADTLMTQNTEQSSAEVQKAVITAHATQIKRQGTINARVPSTRLVALCALTQKDKVFFSTSCQKLNLSNRSVFKTLRIARTIADLENKKRVDQTHLLEALQYRHKP